MSSSRVSETSLEVPSPCIQKETIDLDTATELREEVVENRQVNGPDTLVVTELREDVVEDRHVWDNFRDRSPSESSSSKGGRNEAILATTSTHIVEDSNPILMMASQGSLCNKAKILNMGKSKGRPRKKHRAAKNPFDLGLGKRKLNDKNKFKAKRVTACGNAHSPHIVETNLTKVPEEADLIVETA